MSSSVDVAGHLDVAGSLAVDLAVDGVTAVSWDPTRLAWASDDGEQVEAPPEGVAVVAGGVQPPAWLRSTDVWSPGAADDGAVLLAERWEGGAWHASRWRQLVGAAVPCGGPASLVTPATANGVALVESVRTFGDFDWYVSFTPQVGFDQTSGAVVRWHLRKAAGDYYTVSLHATIGELRIRRFDGHALNTAVAEVNKRIGVLPGVLHRVRMRFVGSALSVRYWLGDEPEPGYDVVLWVDDQPGPHLEGSVAMRVENGTVPWSNAVSVHDCAIVDPTVVLP